MRRHFIPPSLSLPLFHTGSQQIFNRFQVRFASTFYQTEPRFSGQTLLLLTKVLQIFVFDMKIKGALLFLCLEIKNIHGKVSCLISSWEIFYLKSWDINNQLSLETCCFLTSISQHIIFFFLLFWQMILINIYWDRQSSWSFGFRVHNFFFVLFRNSISVLKWHFFSLLLIVIQSII